MRHYLERLLLQVALFNNGAVSFALKFATWPSSSNLTRRGSCMSMFNLIVN